MPSVPDVVVYNADLSARKRRVVERGASTLDIHVVGALNTAQSAVAAMQTLDHGVMLFTVNSLARNPQATAAALSIGKGAQLNLALSLERELEATPIRVGVVTVCGAIQVGTAYDPDLLSEVYWELATQDPAHERDQVI
jgi:NAD(P)-dependent dehydrogenase (short-subunit alcohol dehydrogenase family)